MSLPQPERTHAYLDDHWNEHLDRTRAFLRQPSISAQSIGLRETADCLRAWLEARGAQVSYYGSAQQPIIHAEWAAGARKTLLVYGMYDVQPVDDQIWTTPPFAAEIWHHPAGGESLVARGACNSKGPLMACLHAIEALRATGGLPVNIKWTIEGEEEIGSLALPEFYQTHRSMLAADAAFEPFWSQLQPGGAPRVTLGTKGVIGLEVVCRAGDWGGPRGVVHSSAGTLLGSPAWRLVQALATLVNGQQELVVEGIPPLGEMLPGDDELLRTMAATINPDEYRAQLGTNRLKRDYSPYELLRQDQFAPVLNINGLHSGYLGVGSHTIIPNTARALCDLRMAPGMKVAETYEAVRRHLACHGFEDIEVTMDSGYPAARTPLAAPVVQALCQAYQAHGFEPLVRPMEPSATPYYLFTDVLGLDFAWGGLGTASGSHGPDEWCSLAGLRALEKSLTTFLMAFAASAS
ncbi:MAG: M20/M25/M40 family metallo-hydrolase [Anaerolineales bacterium]|nr:M20/M25/M40 family metallo-hydrolase [Anaerolineales bacterium]